MKNETVATCFSNQVTDLINQLKLENVIDIQITITVDRFIEIKGRQYIFEKEFGEIVDFIKKFKLVEVTENATNQPTN